MKIQVLDEPLKAAFVMREIQQVLAGTASTENGELSDAAARTVASWWPKSIFTQFGSVLQDFSWGREVDRDELLEDISATARSLMGTREFPNGWPRNLELLSTWVINHD